MITEQDIWQALNQVPDPEIPVLSVLDLGIVREIHVDATQTVVAITPTYSGCPATDTIAKDIVEALVKAGISNPEISIRLSPAWTTDWISTAGREKLLAYGIAPPVQPSSDASELFAKPPVIHCPRCKSASTTLVSQFGSTPCKALYRCETCREPFDYFKCI